MQCMKITCACRTYLGWKWSDMSHSILWFLLLQFHCGSTHTLQKHLFKISTQTNHRKCTTRSSLLNRLRTIFNLFWPFLVDWVVLKMILCVHTLSRCQVVIVVPTIKKNISKKKLVMLKSRIYWCKFLSVYFWLLFLMDSVAQMMMLPRKLTMTKAVLHQQS